MKASKEISKYQDNFLIEVNLNMDLNFSINTLPDYINYEEIVPSDIYIKRVEPNFKNIKEEEEEEKKMKKILIIILRKKKITIYML